jgi:heme/copper-type cytochrome/quinol oxidase subunit 2
MNKKPEKKGGVYLKIPMKWILISVVFLIIAGLTATTLIFKNKADAATKNIPIAYNTGIQSALEAVYTQAAANGWITINLPNNRTISLVVKVPVE